MIRYLVLLFGLIGVSVQAAERVGLILSGGAARGLAHVGVLHALEERGVEIEAVAGTSMGSIVGGLYAVGYTPEQIEQVSRNMDWVYAFSDRSPRSHSPYEYRQLDAGLPVDFRLHISRDGIALPRALFQGQHLSLILDEIYAPVSGVQDFNQFPRPYRAVAADLLSGEAVVIDRGSLSTAVRASMSLPGIFEPVEWEGRILVDGGIANNIPLDALDDLELDRLIVVDVGSPRRSNEDIQSITHVMSQLTSLMVRNNSDENLKRLREQDILITPPLDDFGTTDFFRVDDAISAGYDATIAALDAAQLSTVDPVLQPEEAADALVNDAWQAPQTPSLRGVSLHPQIDFIEVDNDGPVSDKVVRAMIRQQEGEPFDAVKLRKDISYIYALDYFGTIRYQLVERNGQTGLRVECRERTTSNSFLRLGLEMSDDFQGNATFGLSASVRAAGINRLGAAANLQLEAGSTPGIELKFYQPLDYRLHYFVEPVIGFSSDRVALYENNDFSKDPLFIFQRQQGYGGFDVGRTMFRQRGVARLGVRRIDGLLEFRAGLPFPNEHYDDGYYFGQLGWDTFDDLAFPTSGQRLLAEHRIHDPGLKSDGRFRQDLLEIGSAYTFGSTTFVAEVSGSVVEEGATPVSALVPIGGFLRLSGLPPDSRWGYHSVFGRLVAVRPIKRNHILPDSMTVYAGASLEHGNVFASYDELEDMDLSTGGSLFLGTRTPLGPGYLAVGFAEGGEQSFNLFFGHVFR